MPTPTPTTIVSPTRQLDGRKAFPINHGACAPEELLQNAGKVIARNFMEVNPEEMRFNIMALAKQPDNEDEEEEEGGEKGEGGGAE